MYSSFFLENIPYFEITRFPFTKKETSNIEFIFCDGQNITLDYHILNLKENLLIYTMNSYRDSGLRMNEMLALIGLTPDDVLLIKKEDVAISSKGRPVAPKTDENLPIFLDLSGNDDDQ